MTNKKKEGTLDFRVRGISRETWAKFMGMCYRHSISRNEFMLRLIDQAVINEKEYRTKPLKDAIVALGDLYSTPATRRQKLGDD